LLKIEFPRIALLILLLAFMTTPFATVKECDVYSANLGQGPPIPFVMRIRDVDNPIAIGHTGAACGAVRSDACSM